MKIFNLVFVILFILFAALQWNDPDPYLWIPIYVFGAWMCWLAYRGRPNVPAMLAGVAVYSIYAIYLFVTDNGVLSWIRDHDAENIAGTMKAETPWIEDSREFFGLVILISVLLVNYFYARKARRGQTR